MRTVLLIAAFDSQLKWCARISHEFERSGFGIRVVVPEVRSALSAGQIAEAGFPCVERVSWSETVALAATCSVVVSGLSGPGTKRMTMDLSRLTTHLPAASRPVLVSGWVGIIIEKITAGYLDRCGTDVIAVNSGVDLAHFRKTAARLQIPGDNLLWTGLPFLSAQMPPQKSGPISRVLFADQPTVPAAPRERRYVYDQLIGYAKRHPERTVLLKPRHRPGEDTYHRMKHHPEDLLHGVPRPANFRIDYTPIHDLVADVDLLVTMSSTASLEALGAGARVALVLDLGIHEKYGNQVFLDSGLLRTFGQIDRDELGRPDDQWCAAYFPRRTRSAPEMVVDRTEQLIAAGERPAQAVWGSPYFVSASEFHHATSRDPSQPVRRRSPALQRRLQMHGSVVGVGLHVADSLLPPVLSRPAKQLYRGWLC